MDHNKQLTGQRSGQINGSHSTLYYFNEDNNIILTIGGKPKLTKYLFKAGTIKKREYIPHCSSSYTIMRPWWKRPKREIYIHVDSQSPETDAYHELGHALHPLGCINNPLLTLQDELAANEWAITNYRGVLSIEEIVSDYKKAIMTYIRSGHTLSHKRFTPIATILEIEKHITFIG